MNLDISEIEHLLWLIENFGCKSAHLGTPHKSECERLQDKLSAIKIATEIYWAEIQKERK